MATTPAKTDKAPNPYRVRLDGVTLSYPHLFKPQKGQDNDTLKFSAAFILDKEKHAEQIKKLQALIKKLLAEKHTGKTIPPDRIFLKDGSLKPDTEGYSEDVMFFNSSSSADPVYVVDDRGKPTNVVSYYKGKPTTVRKDRSPATEADDLFYPGATVNALITIWYQKNEHGVRVNASLEAVQFASHGTRIGASPIDPESVFDDLGSDEDDDPMA